MFLDGVTELVFRTASRLRGGRAFHPAGVAFGARWEPAPAGILQPTSPLGTGTGAVVRLSRAVGLPRGLPDVLGVAVKLPDVHGDGQDQDLLLASVARGAVGRHVLVPARDFTAANFSTVLPYRTRRGRTAVTARVHGTGRWTLADLRTAAAPDLRIELELAAGDGVATLRLGPRRAPETAEDLRFDPWHTGDDLQPAGFLNLLRRPAYQASQHGRAAPATGAPLRSPEQRTRSGRSAASELGQA